ncbi:hypothetical protein SK128_024486, partial [Halocaridina rubra]
QQAKENSQRISALEDSVKRQDVLTGAIDEKVKNAKSLEKDRAYRARTVIIKNIPESQAAQGQERKEEDEKRGSDL